MAEQSGGEKSLPASPRKIEKEREKGKVAKSQDLNSAAVLAMALLGFWAFGPSAFRQLAGLTQMYFSQSHTLLSPGYDIQFILYQALMLMAPAVVPLMLLLLVGGIAINIAQFGFLISYQALEPKFERINVITGFKKFFSLRVFVELVKSIFKLSVIGYVAWWSVSSQVPGLLSLMHVPPMDSALVIWHLLLTIWLRVVLAMIILGLLDYAFQRWQHLQDLRMTFQEAKDELKTLEGDPKIKQRVRQIQRQMAMQRMMGDVEDADVVVTNPIQYAVALRYDVAEMKAPVVVAKGARLVAARIRDLAIEHSVPIVERPELARSLYRTMEVGDAVPENLFRAVAEVLAYVYEIDRREDKIRERDQQQSVPRSA